jgi:REP element-mobilizing transposase RayT
MNNRDYKIFSANAYYHVFNRGNNKQNIFLDSEDFSFFLFRLKESLFPSQKTLKQGRYIRKQLPENSFSLICYCLMPNHFHFLIRQNTNLPISKLIGKICTSYSKYFNKKYNRLGQVFQDQFKSVLVDSDSYLLWLSAYIHQNPKVAGIVSDLKEYKWGSYVDYLGLRKGTLCNQTTILDMVSNNYEDFVNSSFENIRERKELEKLFLD